MFRNFEFGIHLNKAYKDDTGQMHVVGVASDTEEDQQGDRMSERALRKMVRQARENKLPLLETHRSTFEFGRTDDSTLIDKGDSKEFVVDFVLDGEFPQARVLFREVARGDKDKQLSIGGKLNLDNPNTFRFEQKGDRQIRVIEDIELDHIATTRRDHAANDRTGFISAIVKALDEGELVEDYEKGLQEVDKKAVAFKAYPKADEGVAWDFTAGDGQAVLDKGGFGLLKSVHTWFDQTADPDNPSTPQLRGAYKLPHHKIIDGSVRTVFRGVVAAGAAMAGARGGVQIPAGDRRAVASHLVRHYSEFDREPPERLLSISRSTDEKSAAVSDWTTETEKKYIEHHEKQGIDMSWWNEWLKEGVIMSDKIKSEEEKNKQQALLDDDQKSALSFLGNLGGMLRRMAGLKPKEDGEKESEELTEEETKSVGEFEKGVEELRKKGRPISSKRLEALKRAMTLLQDIIHEVAPEDTTKEKKEQKEKQEKKENMNKEQISEQIVEKVKEIQVSVEKAINERADKMMKDIDEDFKAQDERVDAVHKANEDSAKEFKELCKGLDEAIKTLLTRLYKIEKVSGVRQSIEDGNEAEIANKNKKGVFSGVFSRAVGEAKASVTQ